MYIVIFRRRFHENYILLKEGRKKIALFQEYVAKQLGIHRTTITAIELGTRKVTSEELKFFFGILLCHFR
ncbi:helix-turn-helix domain-containing protein [Clostridium drakei]|uniref:helix-turn-helix domain-containing protein n=1 Tax=Clostridium drakei TaxID=332101 RepID=UPI0013786BBC